MAIDRNKGSVYQRADGMLIGSFDHGWNDKGKRHRVTVSTKGCDNGCRPRCPHRDVIRRKIRDKRRQLELHGVSDVSDRDTVKKWATEWLTIRERKVRPSSFNADRSAINRWIVPAIGKKRFDAIGPADVRAIENAQRRAGKSQSTMVRTHSTLIGMLKSALQEGYPVSDRAIAAPRPTVGKGDRLPIPVTDAVALLEASTLIPHGSRWAAAFFQGMRQGECLGLEWDRVDFARGEIHLSWQLQPLPYRIPRDRNSGFRVPDEYEARQLRGRLHLVRPKTRAGYRIAPMVDWMHSALEAWRDVAPTSEHGLVWPMLDGSPTPSKVDDEEFYALQQAAGVHHPSGRWYTPHECRHTTATLLVEAGVDRAVIAAVLGQTRLVEDYVNVRRSPIVREGLQLVAQRLQLPG